MSQRGEQYQLALANIAPYAHPDLWDGHTFGAGELTQVQKGPAHAHRLAADLSREAMKRFINHPGPRHAWQTFHPGQTFSAGDYTEGTVLAFRQEELRSDQAGKARRRLAGIDCDPAEVNQGLPPLTKDFAPYVFERTDQQSSFSRKVSIGYQNSPTWGVVAANQNGQPIIVRVPPSCIWQAGGSKEVFTSTSLLWPTVKIGEVRHTRQGEYERLGRVSLLEVCGYGQAQGQEQSAGVLAFFRRLANGGVA